MSDIFVSYAREDRDFAKEMAASLEEEGWSVWWDRTIPTGRRFHKVIEEALAAARCVIVVWSKHSVGSDWVCAEAGEGMARNVLAPVSIDAARPPLVFRQLQTADLSGWTGDNAAPEFRKLVTDIAAIAPPSQAAQGEPAAPTEPESPAPTPAAPPERESVPTEPAPLPPLPEDEPAPAPAPSPEPPPGRRWWRWALVAAALSAVIFLVAWAVGRQPEPRILRFEVDPPEIVQGERATLRWATRNAELVEIVGAGPFDGKVPAAGERAIAPPKSIRITLVARRGRIERRRTAEVRVVAGPASSSKPSSKPEIVLFEARPPRIRSGESARLVWRVEGAESVGLSESVEGARGEKVPGSGGIEVRPQRTTRYTLDAVNEAGPVWKETTLEVERGGSADLAFAGWGLRPPNPVRGEPVAVLIEVENLGAGEAGAFEIEWWAAAVYGEPECVWRVPGLAPGDRIEVECRYDGYPSWYERIDTVAKIDPQKRVRDGDRSNNESVRQITVGRR